jgi:Uma2 family endonuclease
MVRRTRTGPYLFTEFLEIVRKDQKADLINGVIYMASPENTDHNLLLFWLGQIMNIFVTERQLGRVYINKVAYRLTEDTAPEPDLAFVRADRLGIIRRGYIEGPPDLAVELVSPDSVTRDYEDKRLAYETAGVGEYWIIDPDENQTTFLTRGPSGFVETLPEEHVFRSCVIPGLAIDIRWLWQRPLPSALTIVQRLVAGTWE